MNDLEKDILNDFQRSVDARFAASEIVIFGSRARGEGDPDSDLDVLVILDSPASAADIEAVSECAWQACLGKGILLSPLVVSRQEWEEGAISSSLLAIAVGRDGIRV